MIAVAYQKMRDETMAFLTKFAQEGKTVTAEDVKSFFEVRNLLIQYKGRMSFMIPERGKRGGGQGTENSIIFFSLPFNLVISLSEKTTESPKSPR